MSDRKWDLKIEWDETLSINNEEIDRQHKKWIQIHNRLRNILLTGDTKEISSAGPEILDEMLEYARFHFNFEEEQMRQVGYEGLTEHCRLHKEFEMKISDYRRKVQSGEMSVSGIMIMVLKSWLLELVSDEDKKFSRFLRSTTTER